MTQQQVDAVVGIVQDLSSVLPPTQVGKRVACRRKHRSRLVLTSKTLMTPVVRTCDAALNDDLQLSVLRLAVRRLHRASSRLEEDLDRVVVRVRRSHVVVGHAPVHSAILRADVGQVQLVALATWKFGGTYMYHAQHDFLLPNAWRQAESSSMHSPVLRTSLRCQESSCRWDAPT